MPRKKTGLASSTKKRYIKSTCHCLILCQNIVGGLYTIISEGKFTQSFSQSLLDILCKVYYSVFAKQAMQKDSVSPFVKEILHGLMFNKRGSPMKNRIKELRKANKLSQSELADIVGTTRQTITSIEVGKYTASLGLAYKIAHHFNLTIEEVFDFSEIENEE